jgi:DNA-binding SARP family transcriptional activator
MIDATATRPRVNLLCSFQVTADGEALTLKPASQRLLAYIALADRQVERASTAFRLWPDKDEPRAQANLRSALWRLRQLPTELIECTATHMRLHPEVWVDARHGVQELRDADADTILGATDTMGVTRGAVGAGLSGQLLPEWYEDWLVIERERLRQLQLRCMERACRTLLDSGRWAEAVELSLRAVAVEPLRESAHRLAIEAHLGAGNTGEARRQFDLCRQLLDAELGVAPSIDLRDLALQPV